MIVLQKKHRLRLSKTVGFFYNSWVADGLNIKNVCNFK